MPSSVALTPNCSDSRAGRRPRRRAAAPWSGCSRGAGRCRRACPSRPARRTGRAGRRAARRRSRRCPRRGRRRRRLVPCRCRPLVRSCIVVRSVPAARRSGHLRTSRSCTRVVAPVPRSTRTAPVRCRFSETSDRPGTLVPMGWMDRLRGAAAAPACAVPAARAPPRPCAPRTPPTTQHLHEFATSTARGRGVRRAAHRGQRRHHDAGRARRRVDPAPGARRSSGRTGSPTSTASRRTTPRWSATRRGCASTTAATQAVAGSSPTGRGSGRERPAAELDQRRTP